MTRTLQFSGKPPVAPPAQPDDCVRSEVEQGDRGGALPQAGVSISGELFSQRFRETPSTGTGEHASDALMEMIEPGPYAPGDLIKCYRIVKEIGFGGYARVYHAFNEFLEVDVALKIIFRQNARPKELAARAKAEARFLQALQNPYVVRVYEAGLTESNLMYISMELLSGKTLRSILLKRGKLTWQVALPLFAKVAEGVQSAHAKSVIHRDLKPENIFVLKDGNPKVLDFGIAKFTEGPAITTRENIFHGTPPYMSPEQLAGRTVTGQSDIYAMGIILWEVLAGRHPMLIIGGDNDPSSVAYRNICYHPPLLNDVDSTIFKPITRLVNRLIAKSPKQRPASMAEVADELRACFDKCQAAKRGLFTVFSTGKADLNVVAPPHDPVAGWFDDDEIVPSNEAPEEARDVSVRPKPGKSPAPKIESKSPQARIRLTKEIRTRQLPPLSDGVPVTALVPQKVAKPPVAAPIPNKFISPRLRGILSPILVLAIVGLTLGGASVVLYMHAAKVPRQAVEAPTAATAIPVKSPPIVRVTEVVAPQSTSAQTPVSTSSPKVAVPAVRDSLGEIDPMRVWDGVVMDGTNQRHHGHRSTRLLV